MAILTLKMTKSWIRQHYLNEKLACHWMPNLGHRRRLVIGQNDTDDSPLPVEQDQLFGEKLCPQDDFIRALVDDFKVDRIEIHGIVHNIRFHRILELKSGVPSETKALLYLYPQYESSKGYASVTNRLVRFS